MTDNLHASVLEAIDDACAILDAKARAGHDDHLDDVERELAVPVGRGPFRCQWRSREAPGDPF
jgi:hypothetical protein